MFVFEDCYYWFFKTIFLSRRVFNFHSSKTDASSKVENGVRNILSAAYTDAVIFNFPGKWFSGAI